MGCNNDVPSGNQTCLTGKSSAWGFLCENPLELDGGLKKLWLVTGGYSHFQDLV